MNVLHVHTTDQGGGGAKLVSTLNRELGERDGVESTLVVGEKESDDDSVRQLDLLPLEATFNLGLERVLSLHGLGSPSTLRFPRLLDRYDVDLVHLHNLHGRYFNAYNVRRIPAEIPVVWTIHDMWPLTGHCSVSFDCDRFEQGCGSCPYPDTYPPIEIDTTALMHRVKRRMFDRDDLTLVTPSEWMLERVRRSHLRSRESVHVPHGIDTETYTPSPDGDERETFDLPAEATVVLFLANGFSQRVKGGEQLLQALNSLSRAEDVTLLAIGGTDFRETELADSYDLRLPGYVADEGTLRDAYNAADVAVVPSLYESFGLVATESMACGTPVVAFETSGLAEQITDECGWLCEPFDPSALAEGIDAALADESTRRAKGRAARRRVESEYGLDRFVDDYLDVYADALAGA